MQIKSIAFILVIICFIRCTNEPKFVQQKEENQNIETTTEKDIDFEQFFEQFIKAVKTKNKVEVSYFINFPLHNLHPCYLQTAGKTVSTDTAGIDKSAFFKIYNEVFDDETSWITDTKADSLYTYTADDRNLKLEQYADPKSKIYEFPVVYEQGNSGGTKSLFFAKVKGKYKLFWITCTGNVQSHSKE